MLRDKKIAITGGCGFIGSHLAEHLKNDNEVRIIDDLSNGKLENIQGFVSDGEFVQGSILDSDAVKKALKDSDYVFHAAAIASVFESLRKPELTRKINVDGTLELLTAATEFEVEKFLFISSAAVYGTDPVLPKKEDMLVKATSPYGETKIKGEQSCCEYSEMYGLGAVSVRLFNVYGSRQNLGVEYATVIPKFINLMTNDRTPQIYGDGKQTRDFIYIDDVVEGLILAATKSEGNGEVYNIASGKETSINELVDLLNNVLGKNIKPEHVDPVPGDIRFSVADVSKAKQELGYSPNVDLKEGLKRIAGFYSKS